MENEISASPVKLSDGREITIDLYKLSMDEFRRIYSASVSSKETDGLIGRAIGWEGREVGKLPPPDYRRITDALLRAYLAPLPNSQSASTSA